jgi:hypothetical protein
MRCYEGNVPIGNAFRPVARGCARHYPLPTASISITAWPVPRNRGSWSRQRKRPATEAASLIILGGGLTDFSGAGALAIGGIQSDRTGGSQRRLRRSASLGVRRSCNRGVGRATASPGIGERGRVSQPPLEPMVRDNATQSYKFRRPAPLIEASAAAHSLTGSARPPNNVLASRLLTR